MLGFAADGEKRRYSLTAGGKRFAGETPATVSVPLPRGRTVDARLNVRGGAQLFQVGVTPC